ncbi:cupin domain-containing protein [Dyadobacter sandarakinus]|uniref:Cupin domain-containing protein n=1 Tax=Dyadobacter sandarakinus TaxID=2747268 RepID=A0ABX7I2W8_9BACT|nr:cupin domain-containing protein [Dyadobacter sandarakinus]QRR00130.1 cupin domain-containing protein [Dyadobacter sandarakinus]
MKKFLSIITMMLTALSFGAVAQQVPIFAKEGEKSPNVHHVGNVWLKELSAPDSVFSYGTAVAIFDPGARLDWHSHPGGQILIFTEGKGYYQEKGKPKQTMKPGDVIKCLPGVEHWHGATAESGVTYIATSPAQKGRTIWLQKVTDAEYGPVKK